MRERVRVRGIAPMTKTNQQLLSAALRLRRDQTDAERALWASLRSRQPDGVKFRRQQPIGAYIVDFVSFEHRLIIEVDGGQHDEAPVRTSDSARTAWLEEQGYYVLRFWNSEVLTNTDGVLEAVLVALATPSPFPLPSRERE